MTETLGRELEPSADIEQEIVEQERTLRALEAEEHAGRSLLSPERLRAMREALEDKRRHLADLKLERGEVWPLTPEKYDQKVDEIMMEVVSLEEVFAFALKKGLTKAKLEMLHEGLDAAQEKLHRLDTQTEHPEASKERKAVMKLINDLRKEYPATMQRITSRDAMEPPDLTLSDLRALHRQVKALYADVSPTLEPEKRRAYRREIAELSSLVRRAEDHQDYFKGRAHIQAMASLAMARAARIAPVITVAVDASPKKRGILNKWRVFRNKKKS